MSSPQRAPKTGKCPYDGCDYVPKPSALSQALSINSHISNCHSASVLVWYEGNKITVNRDAKSNTFFCPCGKFSTANTTTMRRHAKNLHQNATKATSSAQASKPTVTPEVGEDERYRVVNPNSKRTLDIRGGEVWVPTGPTVVNKAYPLVAITPMGPPLKAVSARASASTSVSASSSKGASSVASKPKPVIRPASTSASIAGWHTPNSASVSSKRKVVEPTPGPSKVRRVDNARSVSASKAVASSSKITHVAAPKPLFTSAALKTKASTAISSGPASTSASKKRPADGSIPEPSSSKVQRVSKYWPTIAERKATKVAKLSQPDAVPLKASVPSTQPMASTNLGKGKGTRPVVNASPVPGMGSAATAPTPAKKGPPKPRPVVKPGTLAQTSTQAKTQTQTQTQPSAQPSPKSKKHLRPTITAGVAASSASSGYSTSTHGSSSSPRTSATPASTPAPYAAGSSSSVGVSRKCHDCGGWLDAYGKNGLCTMCYVESLPAASPAPAPVHCVICKEEWAGKGNECTMCRLKALSVKNRTTNEHAAPPKPNASASASAVEAKPRKKRVSRQMRQREFERWFAKWTSAHRARRIARPHRRPDAAEEEEGGEEENEDAEGDREKDKDKDKTDWWRVESTQRQGGVSYATPDAFFAALGDTLARHRESVTKDKSKDKSKGKEKGKGQGGEEAARGVLRFFGGYSIVAQPKISAMARLDKLVGRMEEIGFRLDSALQGYVKFQYKSAQGLMDEVYKYPCTCGGTPPPVAENEMRYAHRIPDEKYAGEVCGGTIMLMVGEDNALLAYGIQGQRIAVDIVH